jgi:catechol 2,3-dioxygenase-like lactoylglutathione lyase family enzyme
MNSKLKYLSPILWTKDLEQTISFYENVLGFKKQTQFPNFASMTRDNVELMFVLPIDEPEDCKDPNNKEEFFPKPILTGSIYITTEKVDDLWEKVKGKVKIISPIANREYWMRDFSIYDNNGYELVFGEGNMPDLNNFFQELYNNFNDRKIDLVISYMTDDVKWANGMDGGYVYGHDAVKDYWTRQFTMVSSTVTPLEIENENEIFKIKVHQVVHDLNGNLLADEFVFHFFHLRGNKIALFDIGDKIKN